MIEKLLQKIELLSSEARNIVDRKENITREIEQLDIRLHQVVGAITEIDHLIKEIRNENDSGN
jgi:methyl-accepting chemotaxis protein